MSKTLLLGGAAFLRVSLDSALAPGNLQTPQTSPTANTPNTPKAPRTPRTPRTPAAGNSTANSPMFGRHKAEAEGMSQLLEELVQRRVREAQLEVGRGRYCPPPHQRIMYPRFSIRLPSYDVASNVCQARCPPCHGHAHSKPRLLSYMASFDVASNVCRALTGGGRRSPAMFSGHGRGVAARGARGVGTRRDAAPGRAWQTLPATSSNAL